MPLVPLTRTEATWPPPPSRVMALVMVTAPKPPGSRASISPPFAVLEIAPAQVLQGAVRLHGLASSPTPDTQVRVACACAAAPHPPGSSASISPPFAVLEMAPAQVLQGAVRLHGLASSPTPDTQVRVACACAAAPHPPGS